MRRVLIILLSLSLPTFSVSGPAFADEPPKEVPAPAIESIFKDKNLESAIRAEVFAKRSTQDPITAEDVANISRVVGKGKMISDLSGLEHCKALMLIDLENNQIVDIAPIAGLKRLQSVTLAENKIKDIKPLEGLTSMQLLDLSGNEVDDISALRSMSNLRTLYVANNRLNSLEPISGLTKVWSLDLSKNQIKDLSPIGKFQWLTTLDIRENQIETLEPINELREMDMLLMAGNQVRDLGPLVEMCRKDAESDRRFAPYLEVYLGKNPFDEKVKSQQIATLRSFGVDVHEE